MEHAETRLAAQRDEIERLRAKRAESAAPAAYDVTTSGANYGIYGTSLQAYGVYAAPPTSA